jgi:transcription antitermination protein NusB
LPAVDRNVLRAAIAEMLGFPDTPVPVVINESLEIARRYSAPESLNFLNGVLDAIARQRKSSTSPSLSPSIKEEKRP